MRTVLALSSNAARIVHMLDYDKKLLSIIAALNTLAACFSPLDNKSSPIERSVP